MLLQATKKEDGLVFAARMDLDCENIVATEEMSCDCKLTGVANYKYSPHGIEQQEWAIRFEDNAVRGRFLSQLRQQQAEVAS